ncbi:helix-turn-helix domain-containing protein, partial [Halococcus salifodinae]
MGGSRRKEIEQHLPEEKIDEMLREAEDDDRFRRIGFVKNLYQGDTVAEAADRAGRSPATGGRWVKDWNEGGFAQLMPSYGGGRPPKLDEDEQDCSIENAVREYDHSVLASFLMLLSANRRTIS